MLINDKMSIGGILTYMSMINFMHSLIEHEKSFIMFIQWTCNNSNPDHFKLLVSVEVYLRYADI